MKVNPISVDYSTTKAKNIKRTNVSAPESVSVGIPTGMSIISFKGNSSKKPHQIVGYATESNYLGGIYKAGGLGDVAEALPEAIGNHGESVIGKPVDKRTFYPYYSMDNGDGKIYVAKEGTEAKTQEWNKWLSAKKAAEAKKEKFTLPKPEQPTLSNDYILVDQNYKLQKGERFALVTEIGNGKAVNNVHFLNDTGIQDSIKRVKMNSLDLEVVPYKVFEVDTMGKRKDKMYILHTKEIAGGKSAYGIYNKYKMESSSGSTAYGGVNNGSSAYGGTVLSNGKREKLFSGNAAGDMFWTEQTRAMQHALENHMDQAKHGNFNPQNYLLHDRFANMIITDAMESAAAGNKYWTGIKYAPIYHNPGRGYQGVFGNPLDFFRIVATESDVERLKASPHYNNVKDIADKITNGKATVAESEQLYNFFEPYFKQYIDSEGTFNMTKIALAATEEAPDLISSGHVSVNYGKEAKNAATVDIAKGLTDDFARLDKYIISVTNGAKPANMATNNQYGFFGTGKLNAIFSDISSVQKYTPFDIKADINTIYDAKLANKKNLLDIIGEATAMSEKDPDAIAKVFFSEDKMKGIRGKETDLKLTLGGLSKYEKGDLLFISWGRPDPQKGLKTTARAFRMFLQDETVPLEIRKHSKLLFGAGGGNDAWKLVNGKSPAEWEGIKEELKLISEIEVGGQKGIFKNNACYVNGLFPNRIANCADLSVLTSRYEPCGITPFESYATATPCLSVNTGGAPDFIREGKTGFLTKDPFMLNPEKLGLKAGAEEAVVDNARVENTAKQVKDKLKEYVKSITEGNFETKQKEMMNNCRNEKIEWHNNNAYNNGKSALEVYLKDKLNTTNNEVNGAFKTNGRGAFNESAFTDAIKDGGTTEKPSVNSGETKSAWTKIVNFFKSKPGKITAGATAGVAIIGGILLAGKKAGWFNKHDSAPKVDNFDYDFDEDDHDLSAIA